MTAAYLIVAHRDPAMFQRLVAALPNEASVYAHIDARVQIEPFKEGCGRVTFLDERMPINWGSWAQVQAAMHLLEAALADSSVTRCTLLSGQCYPILSPSALDSWQQEPIDFLEIVAAPNSAWGKEAWRFDRRWSGHGYRNPHSPVAVASAALIRRFAARQDPSAALGGRRLYAGPQWWSFTRSTAELAVHAARHDRALTQYFSHTYCPDESFWHTAIGSDIDLGRLDRGCTYINWDGTAHPAPLTSEDVIREAHSASFAFARKFSSNQPELLEVVDQLRLTRRS